MYIFFETIYTKLYFCNKINLNIFFKLNIHNAQDLLAQLFFIFLTQPKRSHAEADSAIDQVFAIDSTNHIASDSASPWLSYSSATAAANYFVIESETIIFFISKFKMFSISLIEFPTNFKEFKRNQRINGKIRTTPTAFEKKTHKS